MAVAHGSISPYFFNAGLLYSGALLNAAADAYAKILTSSRIPEFDVLFGPAYKGISLAAVTTVALARDHGRDQAYCYNRKEKKDVSGGLHGLTSSFSMAVQSPVPNDDELS